jgi:hypothetical protein
VTSGDFLPEPDLCRSTLIEMKPIIQLVLTAALLSSPALAQTTEPTPESPAPIVAPETPETINPFGIAFEFGINPTVSAIRLDYDVTPNFNLRFGISPSPQVIEAGAAYVFRNTPDWRLYGSLGVAYRFDANPALFSRVIASLAIGLEYPFGLFFSGPSRPPIWSRIEFGISSLSDLFSYSYSNSYPGPGLYVRSGIVIRF